MQSRRSSTDSWLRRASLLLRTQSSRREENRAIPTTMGRTATFPRRGTHSLRHLPRRTRRVLARLHENLRVLISPKESQGDVRRGARGTDLCTRHGKRTSLLQRDDDRSLQTLREERIPDSSTPG